MAQRVLKVAAVVSGLLIVVLIIGAIALAALSNTSAFLVTSIQTYDSEHVSADTVARLAYETGTPLIGVREGTVICALLTGNVIKVYKMIFERMSRFRPATT